MSLFRTRPIQRQSFRRIPAGNPMQRGLQRLGLDGGEVMMEEEDPFQEIQGINQNFDVSGIGSSVGAAKRTFMDNLEKIGEIDAKAVPVEAFSDHTFLRHVSQDSIRSLLQNPINLYRMKEDVKVALKEKNKLKREENEIKNWGGETRINKYDPARVKDGLNYEEDLATFLQNASPVISGFRQHIDGSIQVKIGNMWTSSLAKVRKILKDTSPAALKYLFHPGWGLFANHNKLRGSAKKLHNYYKKYTQDFNGYNKYFAERAKKGIIRTIKNIASGKSKSDYSAWRDSMKNRIDTLEAKNKSIRDALASK